MPSMMASITYIARRTYSTVSGGQRRRERDPHPIDAWIADYVLEASPHQRHSLRQHWPQVSKQRCVCIGGVSRRRTIGLGLLRQLGESVKLLEVRLNLLQTFRRLVGRHDLIEVAVRREVGVQNVHFGGVSNVVIATCVCVYARVRC